MKTAILTLALALRLTGRVALAALLLLLIVAAPARADKCTGAKLKAIGKKESGLLGCQSKVAATGDSSGLAACETKISGKFSTSFGKAGACAGDETTCENIADSCESSVAGAFIDTFPSKCESAKRKAAGKLASSEFACYAKGAPAAGLAIDSACITKASGKFTAAMTKAGACPDGGSPQTFVEDNCVRPAFATNGAGVVTEACPAPPTTTSTTTTTVTTTTIPPRQTCGTYPTCGGSCPAGQTCVAAAQQCLCFDASGCTASYPACSGTCSSGGACTSFNTSAGSFCACLNGPCACGGSCPDPLYECLDSGSMLGCGCFSGQ